MQGTVNDQQRQGVIEVKILKPPSNIKNTTPQILKRKILMWIVKGSHSHAQEAQPLQDDDIEMLPKIFLARRTLLKL